jgi:hypothetical protein
VHQFLAKCHINGRGKGASSTKSWKLGDGRFSWKQIFIAVTDLQHISSVVNLGPSGELIFSNTGYIKWRFVSNSWFFLAFATLFFYFMGGVGAVWRSARLLHSLSAVCFGVERNRPTLNCRDTWHWFCGIRQRTSTQFQLQQVFEWYPSNDWK